MLSFLPPLVEFRVVEVDDLAPAEDTVGNVGHTLLDHIGALPVPVELQGFTYFQLRVLEEHLIRSWRPSSHSQSTLSFAVVLHQDVFERPRVNQQALEIGSELAVGLGCWSSLAEHNVHRESHFSSEHQGVGRVTCRLILDFLQAFTYSRSP